MIAFCLQLSATGMSQRITLSLKQAPLAKVFDEISRQTGLSVVYREDLLKDAKPVTVEVKDATVEEVMNACFADQPLGLYDQRNNRGRPVKTGR